MATFTDMFRWLGGMGLADSLLPFLLVFAIVFAVLQQVKLFGEDKKNIHIVIALIMGFLFVLPHVTGAYRAGADPVDIINKAIPNVGVMLVAIIMLMLIVGVFGAKLKVKGTPLTAIVILLAFGFVLYIFGWAAGWWHSGGFPSWLGFLGDAQTRSLLVVLAVFLILVFFIIGGGSKSTGQKGVSKFFDWFKGLLE